MTTPRDPAPEQTGKLAEDTTAAAELIESILADRALLRQLEPALLKRLLAAVGRLAEPDDLVRRTLSRAQRRARKAKARNAERALLDRTGIRQLRENPIFQTPLRQNRHAGKQALPPPIGESAASRSCYTCRASYQSIHFFYDQMCLECGDFNFRKREQTADLRGRVALVTGARVKIGFQAAIMLLRAGCHVIVTTRFPADAAIRYSNESDFAEWSDRLEIHGIDLRHIPNVELLCERLLSTHDRLDFIVNNACQTVRRPPGFYDHLMQQELSGGTALPERASALLANDSGLARIDAGASLPSAALSQVPLLPGDSSHGEASFPTGHLDADRQQVDLREVNSWRLQLHDVPTVELLEVHLVNAVAPFILNARLKPLMLAVPTADKHIVNVSAMEGQFYRTFKSSRHPHTNMAKAALNMLTRTSSLDYIESGIHMNSVDTGWVTDEDPVVHAEIKREMHGFHPPLDIVDGAARILDPIFNGIKTGEHVWGQMLKDYRPADW